MKKFSHGAFAVVFCLCIFFGVLGNERTGFIAITGGENSVSRKLMIKGDVPVHDMSNYVSMTDIGGGRFAISNYENIFIFDRRDGAVCAVSIMDDNEKMRQIKMVNGFPFSSESVINPTGVYFAGNNKLYVANYKINNILEGVVDAEGCGFTVEHEYASPSSLGPENVWVDEGSNLLLSANYDAGTVTAFDIDSKHEVWVANVPQAHGVTASNGMVYATGLTERKIYKINISTGEIVQKRGGLGWGPMNSEFMWPTSIYPFSGTEMIVADAQSGFISIVSSENLDTIRYTGGNGPSENLFNYPYAAIPFGNDIAIMQSQRKEVLFISRKEFSISERFYFLENKWPEQRADSLIFGRGWEGYQDFSGNNVRILDDFYRLGFGGLHALTGRRILKMPDVGTLFNDSAYVYFLQAHNSEDLSVLWSSGSRSAYGVARMRDGLNILVPKRINLDSWLVGETVVSEGGVRIDVSDLENDFLEMAGRYHEHLFLSGWVGQRDLYDILDFADYGHVRYELFLEKLNGVFSTPEGRRFKLAYDICSDADVCDLEMLRSAARKYFLETRYLPYLPLDEYLLVGMLTGVVANDELYRDIEYGDCGRGAYYPGHGLDVLYTETLDDYLAATDMQGSVVCFSLKDELPVSGLEIVWNDMETASRSIEIYGRKSVGQGAWKLIGQFSDYPVRMKDGYANSFIGFPKAENYAEFSLQIINGEGQQRLLARRIQPVIFQSMVMACHDSNFIEGYGVAALKTPSLQDYMSASDLASSSVCFSNPERLGVTGVKIGWFSEDEAGVEVEVFGADLNDFSDAISIGRFSLSYYDEDGYWFSDVDFDASGNYPFYKIKLVEGLGQNRLMLRHISLVSE